MNDEHIQLRNIDPEDIDDVIIKIENSFGFKFTQRDLKDVNNFGKLCDAVLCKIDLPHDDGCTSQQAFYKLREAITEVTGIDKRNIHPSSKIADIFPREGRRKQIKQMEAIVGVSLKMLKPKTSVSNFLTAIIIVAFIFIFLYWQFGLAAFILAIICYRLASHFGKELKTPTIREATEQFACYNYNVARRNQGAINKKEVEEKVKLLFMTSLYLPERALTRDASFN